MNPFSLRSFRRLGATACRLPLFFLCGFVSFQRGRAFQLFFLSFVFREPSELHSLGRAAVVASQTGGAVVVFPYDVALYIRGHIPERTSFHAESAVGA